MASALAEKVKSVFEPQHGDESAGQCCSTLSSGPGYASPQDALKGPREKLLYITAVYTGPPSFAHAVSTPYPSSLEGGVRLLDVNLLLGYVGY